VNRRDRRRAEAQARRNVKVGDVIWTTTISAVLKTGEHVLYWIRVPDGMSNEEAARTQEWHGPFKTDAELKEDQRVALLGRQCKVTEGGAWDPNWDKPQ
jgi:hypothetical protein